MIELAGPEQFLVDLYTDTEEVEALLEVMEEKLNEQFAMSLDTPADIFWQPDNITVDMTPPAAFEKYCLPFYKKQSKLIRSTQKPYFLHIDGKFKPLIDMLKDSGISGIESVSIPEMGGDMYIDQIRQLLPDHVIIPNFPSNLAQCNEAAIQKYVCSLKDQMGNQSFMLQISEDIPTHSWKHVLPILNQFF